jgi:hypothetical protein
MPIIYISGDSGQEWLSKGVPRSVMIAKPFVPAQLITAVTTLISGVDTNRSSADGRDPIGKKGGDHRARGALRGMGRAD